MHWPHFDLHAILLDIREDIGQIRGQLMANTDRLDRIEDRMHRQREPVRLTDALPIVWGLGVLALAASGKIEWAAVAGLLGSGR